MYRFSRRSSPRKPRSHSERYKYSDARSGSRLEALSGPCLYSAGISRVDARNGPSYDAPRGGSDLDARRCVGFDVRRGSFLDARAGSSFYADGTGFGAPRSKSTRAGGKAKYTTITLGDIKVRTTRESDASSIGI